MRKDKSDRWLDDVDADRVRATRGGIAGGWLVVAALAALMLIVPPTINAAEMGLFDAKQQVAKVEQRLAQSLSRPAVAHDRPC